MLEKPSSSDHNIHSTWAGLFQYPALVVADQLGLFQLLKENPFSLEEITKTIQISFRGANALCSVAAAAGFLHYANTKYALTSAGKTYLLPESPYYWGGMLQFQAKNPHVLEILNAIQTELKTASRNEPLLIEEWKEAKVDLERARIFTRAMQSQSFAPAMLAAESFDFSTVKNLLDVGGGSGGFSIALAHSHPQINCSVLDLLDVCTITQEYIDKYKHSERVKTVAGDMFRDPFPLGYDAVLFSNIFHDWDENKCRLLAKKAFDALPSGGRIFLNEVLMDDDLNGPMAAAAFNIVMLIRTEGRQFSGAQLKELLLSVGFKDIEKINTGSVFSLIVGVK